MAREAVFLASRALLSDLANSFRIVAYGASIFAGGIRSQEFGVLALSGILCMDAAAGVPRTWLASVSHSSYSVLVGSMRACCFTPSTRCEILAIATLLAAVLLGT